MTQDTFDNIQRLVQEDQHSEVLQICLEELKHKPNDPALLYIAGSSAYLLGQFSEAILYWTRLKKLAPQDFRIRGRLVQTYETLQDFKGREVEREEIIALYRQLKGRPNVPPFYLRDQFKAGPFMVQANEHFELEGDKAKRYAFVITRQGASKADHIISLGSYEATNQYAHQRGQLQPGERLFHMDEYRFDGQHRTLAFFKNEPPYEVIKAGVLEHLSKLAGE